MTVRPGFLSMVVVVVSVLSAVLQIHAQPTTAVTKAPTKTILAIGAHAGDMELTAGAVLIKQRKLGDRVVILQMTLGEGGNPRLSPGVYGAQKRARRWPRIQ